MLDKLKFNKSNCDLNNCELWAIWGKAIENVDDRIVALAEIAGFEKPYFKNIYACVVDMLFDEVERLTLRKSK
jgi:hypothetical protein